MAARKNYDITNSNKIEEAFKQIKPAPKTQVNSDELVVKYKSLIRNALTVGCSFEDICEQVFKPNNCLISANTLKDTYNKLLRNQSLRKPLKPFKTEGTPEANSTSLEKEGINKPTTSPTSN